MAGEVVLVCQPPSGPGTLGVATEWQILAETVVANDMMEGLEDARPYVEGDVIASKYRLTSLLGEGGMGSVWLARNLTLHVDVAIKLIRRDIAQRSVVAERLLREARAAAQLGHPSIVRVHDFGTTERDDPFIVMELLNGESLADVLDRKGFLPPVNAVQMLLPILGALNAAHTKGIVHRDLKPENIILVADETGSVVPKLVDFGIAKLKRERVLVDTSVPAQEAPVRGRRLTMVGAVMGSPEYMSPQQAEGGDVDERADLWSMAVLLYECVVGDRPFDGDRYEDLLISILTKEPMPITAHGCGDDILWKVIEQGLRKNPTARWQSAQQMGGALAQWLLDQGIELDIGGTSLKRQWTAQQARPSSAEPPMGLVADPLGVNITPEPSMASPELSRRRAATTILKINRRAALFILGACATVIVIAVAAIWTMADPSESTQAPAGEPSPQQREIDEPDEVIAAEAPASAAPVESAAVAEPPPTSSPEAVPTASPSKGSRQISQPQPPAQRPSPVKPPLEDEPGW